MIFSVITQNIHLYFSRNNKNTTIKIHPVYFNILDIKFRKYILTGNYKIFIFTF